MTLFRILGVLLLILAVALPIGFRVNKWIRYIAVVGLLLFAICLIHFGLGRAARNVSLPSRDVMLQQVEYATAWSVGRIATQDKVDLYLRDLIMINVAMAVLALVPSCFTNKKQ